VGNAFYPLGNVAADAATATGERRRYVLSDGSQLLLDARSRVNLDFTPAYRQVRLLDGAVTVSVAPDARRPFLVQTAEGTVRALGTRYMVRQQAQRTLVVVHEHEVEVETMSGAHGTVRAGTGARFDAARMDTPRAELMAEAAWEAGWVEARGRPLAEVIAALRPYRSGTLRVSMAAGGLPVSGHFPLDDTDAALDTLRDIMPIHVRRFTPWFVSISVAT
jgi:transmembrane sensor